MSEELVPLLTEKEVARWLGLSVCTLIRLRNAGNGPAVVTLSPRRVAYRRAVVDTWIAEREQSAKK